MKSNEDDLRLCVIRQLLTEGWKREDIRLEIPMCTASSGGRADIVCLSDKYIGAIELKSGKDKYCPNSIKEQCKPYLRAFDYCGIVVDSVHHEIITRKKNGRESRNDNFSDVDLVYYHSCYRPELSRFKSDPNLNDKYCEQITKHLFQKHWGRSKSRNLSVYDMASVLWADELREAFKSKGTKSSLEIYARDSMGVAPFRPILLKALRERPLNEWELSFWKKFDAIDWPIDNLKAALEDEGEDNADT